MFDGLEQFLLVAEHGTFTEAARRAHLSQPALTAAMQRLELHFGARLFDRGRRGAELTAAGQALLPRVRAALATIEDGRRAIAEIEGLDAGEVRLGAGATACSYLLPTILAKFRLEHPGVRFRLSELTTDEALDELHDGTIDLALLSGTDEKPAGELWLVDHLILVASPDTDPKSTPFLTFRRGTTTRAIFDRYFPNADVVMELGSIAAVKGNIRAGIGKALVSENAVRDDLRRGHMVKLRHRHTPIKRDFRIVHRGIDRLPPAAAELRNRLLQQTHDAKPKPKPKPKLKR